MGNESLNLTEENREAIRSLVTELSAGLPEVEARDPRDYVDMEELKKELSLIVRRSFTKKLVTQIYNSSPLITALLNKQE